MFRIMNQDMLLNMDIVNYGSDKKEFRIVNVAGTREELDINLRIVRIGGNRGMPIALTLRELANEYYYSGITLGQWLDDRHKELMDWLRKPENFEKILQTCADPSVIDRRSDDKYTAEDRERIRWIKLDSIRALEGTQEDKLCEKLLDQLAADGGLWKRDPSLPTWTYSENVKVTPGVKLPSFQRELCKAKAEAQSLCASWQQLDLDFRPYLESALDRYWTDIFSRIDVFAGLQAHSDGGKSRVESKVEIIPGDEKIPPERLSFWKRLSKHGPVHDRSGTDAFQGTTIRLSCIFMAPQSKERFWAETILYYPQPHNPKSLANSLKERLGPCFDDVVYSLQEFFEHNYMTIFFGLTFDNLTKCKEFCPKPGDNQSEIEWKIKALSKSYKQGSIRIKDKDSGDTLDAIIPMIRQFAEGSTSQELTPKDSQEKAEDESEVPRAQEVTPQVAISVESTVKPGFTDPFEWVRVSIRTIIGIALQFVKRCLRWDSFWNAMARKKLKYLYTLLATAIVIGAIMATLAITRRPEGPKRQDNTPSSFLVDKYRERVTLPQSPLPGSEQNKALQNQNPPPTSPVKSEDATSMSQTDQTSPKDDTNAVSGSDNQGTSSDTPDGSSNIETTVQHSQDINDSATRTEPPSPTPLVMPSPPQEEEVAPRPIGSGMLRVLHEPPLPPEACTVKVDNKNWGTTPTPRTSITFGEHVVQVCYKGRCDEKRVTISSESTTLTFDKNSAKIR